MSAATSIGLVSESLRNLLLGEMRLYPMPAVTLLAPDEAGGERRLNLFLYKVMESPYMRNLDWRLKSGEANKLVPPPLSLNLFYLMTAYSVNDPETGNATAHRMLGEAMRVLHENPVVLKPYLAPELEGAPESIEIVLNTHNMEELAHIWGTFQRPFRPSVLYEISILQLDLLPENERILPQRVRRIGVPAVDAGFRPPGVDRIEPEAPLPGETVRLFGRNFSNRRIRCTIPGLSATEAMLVNDSVAEFRMPAEVPPGLYQLRIDVEQLFRRSFVFEITEANS